MKDCIILNTIELHLSWLIGMVKQPDKQIIRIIRFFLNRPYCQFKVRYVPESKLFDHTWFEVLEAITLYSTWFDTR